MSFVSTVIVERRGFWRQATRYAVTQLDDTGYLDDAFLFHIPALNVILVHPEACFLLELLPAVTLMSRLRNHGFIAHFP